MSRRSHDPTLSLMGCLLRPSGRRRLMGNVGGAAALFVLFVSSTAAATATVSHPLPSAAQLLAGFEAAYSPAHSVTVNAAALAYERDLLKASTLPSVSLTQRSDWRPASGGLGLNVDLAVTAPLYSSRSAPAVELHEATVALNEADANLARSEARGSLLLNAMLAVALQGIHERSTRALGKLEQTGWLPPSTTEEAARLSPYDREVLTLYDRVRGQARFAAQQSRLVHDALSAALARPASELPPLPDPAALLGELAAAIPPFEACVASSPYTALSSLQREADELELVHDRTLDFTVELNAGADYSIGGSGAGELVGRVAVEARLALPASSPVGGQLSVSGSPEGFDQQVQLRWPQAPSPDASYPRKTPDEAYAADVAAIRAELRTTLENVAVAHDSAEAARVQLLWAARDLLPLSQTLLATELADLAQAEAADPLAELQLELARTDVALAQFAYAEQLVEAATACGVLQ